MRLSKLRLAGFKSFVDPTTVPIPGDLVAVVGPNGCGKSNIIDAVRWVMGEISARHLRGDSMADVVFNGSSVRQPLGQATVELVFDNSDASIGGRYTSYAEIAVRRQVARDGQSSYFLNGTRCRRRDITDLFLGTGLGPRSYAIIEQGMISRLIEARPDELREFIEEAAGISKYKERRRETETRIRHTRDNLERLQDIREELEKRLVHLKRQAAAAERYRELKQEQRRLEAQLLGLRWKALDAHEREQGEQVRAQEVVLDEVGARLRALEARLLEERGSAAECQEQFNTAYREVQEAAAGIARAEGEITRIEERTRQLEDDRKRERANMERAAAHAQAERERRAALRSGVEAAEPACSDARRAAETARAAFEAAERAMHEWQEGYEGLSERAAQPARAVDLERARVRHAEESLAQLRLRAGRLHEERGRLDGTASGKELSELQASTSEQEADLQAMEDAIEARRESIRRLREEARSRAAELDHERSGLQERRGRLASLRALQQAALGKSDGALEAWLRERALDGRPRLGERLEVEAGWERAVERVLGAMLGAVCVERLEAGAEDLPRLKGGAVALFEDSSEVSLESGGTPDAASTLAERVRAPAGVRALLRHVGAVEDLAEGLRRRRHLGAGESLVTRAGERIGPNWLSLEGRAGGRAGVIAREREIRALDTALNESTGTVAGLEAELDEARERLHDEEDRHASAQQEFSQAQREHVRQRAELAKLQARLQQMRTRAEAIDDELEELSAQEQRHREELDAARVGVAALAEEVQRMQDERARWAEHREELRARLGEARSHWQVERDRAYALEMELKNLRAQLEAAEQGQRRDDELVEAARVRLQELEVEIEAQAEPLVGARRRLDECLETRHRLERGLASARAALEEGETRLRSLEGGRQTLLAEVERERSGLERLRVASEEARVRRATVEEQMDRLGRAREAVVAELPEDAREQEWVDKIAALERSVARLGPINLAAIEEFQQETERKQYLDSQNADLEAALGTLVAAIEKIDRETRARFKETYERVNAGLGRMFPKLFGGGAAYLEMTGEDLLNTGITVMARPPGKRNGTIQLLSGGEKALTAVALVFSIFELNPAPFCLLDEVDAPLDDSNVLRFIDLVREMSQRVQMLVVTHNKNTMEAAQQLIGVTMNEPGVSRLVAVDVEQAVAMAAS